MVFLMHNITRVAFLSLLGTVSLLGNLFAPLEEPVSHNFILKQFEKIPYRLQLKGIVEWKDGVDRYIFVLDDRELISMSLNTRSDHGFCLTDYDAESQIARVNDLVENVTMPLKLGRKTYKEGQFSALVQDAKTQATYHFSDRVHEHLLADGSSIRIRNINTADNSLILIECVQGHPPYAYKLNLNNANEISNEMVGH